MFPSVDFISLGIRHIMNTHDRQLLLFILIGAVLIILEVNFCTHFLYAQNSMHSGHVTNNTISKYTGQENRLSITYMELVEQNHIHCVQNNFDLRIHCNICSFGE